MPSPANRPPSSNVSQGGTPIRRRSMRRRGRLLDLSTRNPGELEDMPALSRAAENAPYRRVPSEVGSSGGLARSSCGPVGALARPSTPVPIATSWRQSQVTIGGPEVDLRLLSSTELRAGQDFLDRASASSANLDAYSDVGEDEAHSAVRPSFSRAISAMRARLAGADGPQGEISETWRHARVLEASDSSLSVVDILVTASEDALGTARTDAGATAQAMLDREVANDQANLGSEMVESDIRRAMAEQSLTRLELCCGRAAARQSGGMRALRAYIQAFKDADLRTAATRVMNCRIDPTDATGFVHQQLVYRNVTGLCHDVGLRELAELVWAAIQDAPVSSDKREQLRALLLYNIADCANGDTFHCINGTFQRLLAPLDGIYPGVHTLARTPYEVVRQVSLTWREAIAKRARADTPDDWSAFERACMRQAEDYFAPDTALYPLIEEQLQRAIAVCRTALLQEI